MRSWLTIITLCLLGAGLANAQTCPPGCVCACTTDLLLYECANGDGDFVLGDDNLFTAVSGVTASFTVSGLAGQTTIGSATIPFVIGSSESRVRFTYPNSGECVGTSGVGYPDGFPAMLAVQGRALQMSKRNPLYCRDATRDLICFQVKGQVGPPFPKDLTCTPDRVEYACGVVS
jgi:hypothetical protein